MWQLKKDQHPFEMVDGPLAGIHFIHNRFYATIPEALADRFEHPQSEEQIQTEPAANDEPTTEENLGEEHAA